MRHNEPLISVGELAYCRPKRGCRNDFHDLSADVTF
jgi:hypothetical protein